MMNLKNFSLYFAGCLFSTGLIISGMVNPDKILSFLDVAGDWDPSLAWVMVGAIITTSIGYRLAFKRTKPTFSSEFSLPTKIAIDPKLVVGAVLFGLGWGISGLCPGPALTVLGFAPFKIMAFLVPMAIAMVITHKVQAKV
ncbi:MAG: putative membrane protein YedE/YeeE [Saprospiraceae bacterium]|jgi:uncharacterized membrane protein YedE/YeeE